MKLFVTDYDQTLYTDDISIKENNKMLKKLQKNDFKVVISTGRSLPSIKKQIDAHHIPYDYVSCADGSIVYDNAGNIVELFFMDKEIVKPYQKFYKKIKYETLQFVYPEGYSDSLKEDDNNLLGINICISNANYTKDILNQFIEMSEKYTNYSFLNYMHIDYSYLCVKPKGISKSSTIKCLMEKNNILFDDIYVIGDSYNDFEMIRDYNGVCMNTSCQDVLDIAKKKYKSVYDYIVDILKEI